MSREITVNRIQNENEDYMLFTLTDTEWPDLDVKFNMEFSEVPTVTENFREVVKTVKKAMNDRLNKIIKQSDDYKLEIKYERVSGAVNRDLAGPIDQTYYDNVKKRLYS